MGHSLHLLQAEINFFSYPTLLEKSSSVSNSCKEKESTFKLRADFTSSISFRYKRWLWVVTYMKMYSNERESHRL